MKRVRAIVIACLILIAASLACIWASTVERFEERPARFCVCMLYTDDIASYASLTERINRAYSQRHGYDFVAFRRRFASDRAPQWDKVKAVEACLARGYDFVFWIDADAFFNVHEMALETFVDDEHDVFICDDMPNSAGINDCSVNTGTMLIRNSAFSRALLKRWWNSELEQYAYGSYHEQTVLDIMIKSDAQLARRVKIYPAKAFNSVGRELNRRDTDWLDTFVVHMMSNSPQLRRSVALAWLEENEITI